jgi:dTMP kinase
MTTGFFITFEGGEGVGKTTQLRRAAEWLRSRGIEIVETREPGGTPRAEQIRQLLLAHDAEAMPPASELLLMFAARALHLANLVQPALDRGAWVLCDRFTDATYAYQGGGRRVSREEIDALVRIVHPGRWPDLTLLLDAAPATGLTRALARTGSAGPDRFESEALDFFERVRATYLARAQREPGRIRVIDASGDAETVFVAVQRELESLSGSDR